MERFKKKPIEETGDFREEDTVYNSRDQKHRTQRMDFNREVKDLTLAEMLGEAFMPRLEADTYVEDPEYAEQINQLVRDHVAGGFCVFNATAYSTAEATEALQKVAMDTHGIPLLFSCDCEWGLPMRLRSGGTEFPDAMALGRSHDGAQTEAIGRAIGKEMKALGLHWNFAPVADVNSNHKNPIINTRSFGEGAESVSVNVAAYVRGLESEGVAGSVKHFPGHGDTEVDSHKDLPRLMIRRERFDSLEFVPFKSGIAAGVKSVMLGHIAIPELAKQLGATGQDVDLPATLSPHLCRMLREEWGYDGILVTDGLEMHGLTKYFDNDEACLRSFSAGLDVLLIPVDTRSAFRCLLAAAQDGRLSSEKIEASARRILEMKRWVHTETQTDPDYVMDNEAHLTLGRNAARRALVIRGNLPQESFTGVLVLADARATTVAKARYLTDRIEATLPTVVLTPETGATDFRSDLGDRPLVAILHKARGFIGGLGDTSTVQELIKETSPLLRAFDDLTIVCFGSPYLDPLFEDLSVKCMIKTYSESTTSIDVVLETLGGRL